MAAAIDQTVDQSPGIVLDFGIAVVHQSDYRTVVSGTMALERNWDSCCQHMKSYYD